MEALKLDGLKAIQKIEVGATALDVLVHEDVLYVSVDAKEGDWIREYRFVDGDWKRSGSSRWKISEREEGSKVELYYLEANRKKQGSQEDD